MSAFGRGEACKPIYVLLRPSAGTLRLASGPRLLRTVLSLLQCCFIQPSRHDRWICSRTASFLLPPRIRGHSSPHPHPLHLETSRLHESGPSRGSADHRQPSSTQTHGSSICKRVDRFMLYKNNSIPNSRVTTQHHLPPRLLTQQCISRGNTYILSSSETLQTTYLP